TYYYDAFGNIEEEKYYDANGNLTTTPINNNIRYAGYQYDEETGLYYLNARMYDPKIARFLQEDTYRGDPNDPLSLNLYTYVKNNPLVYYDPTGHWPEWLDKKFENAKQWVNKKIKSVSDAASNVLNTAKNYVNEKVVQPVGQTIQKGKEVIEYVIENKPSSLKDGLALGTGIALTTFKNNVYDPFVDKVTAVDAIVSVGNYMEFYDEAQKRFEYFENNVTNSLGIQDNEYYYIGGTLTGAYNTIKGTAQFAGGTLIGVRGIRDTTIGIKGILSGGGTISLTLTAAGVGELMLAAEGSASGVFKASSGFDSFNRNYEKFAKMTEGTPKTWTSPDKYVGETANAIEARYPSKVVDVNKIAYRPDGTILTDFDIELDNTIIQVKAGTAKGLTSQIIKTTAGTTKEVIGFAPELNPSSALVKNASKQGIKVFTSLEDLLEYLK
ncbi:RHS repeat-associated core domain-containing protein, partial [Acetivibrio mesophilus]